MVDVHTINTAIESGGEGYWRLIYTTYFRPLVGFFASEYGPVADDIGEELRVKSAVQRQALAGGGAMERFLDELERCMG